MMKKILCLLLAMLLTAGLFTGCAQGNTDITAPQGDTTAPPPQQTQPPAEALADTPAPLELTEVMPDNRHLLLGSTLDWVELYNGLEGEVSLDGYFLTDDPAQPEKYALNGKTLRGESYLAVSLEKDLQLSENGGSVYLTYRGETVAALTYPAPQNGESFDAQGGCAWPTPGFANTRQGYEAYLDSRALPELAIHEVMVSNDAYYSRKGLYYDWVEVKNTSDHPLSLKEYYLTDSFEGRNRYLFPDVTLQPGQLYVVICSGNEALGDDHAGFKLGTEGESLYLAHKGTYVDALQVPEDLKHNESYGRSGKLPVYLQKPTPGQENTEGYPTGISAPVPDVTPGEYDGAVTVTLSGEGKIYYTLDGSRPTTGSRVYKEPITIKDMATIRTFCVSNGRRSELAAYTYVVGKDHTLPIVTLALPNSSLYGQTGVLNREDVENRFEREGIITLIEDGEVKFCEPFGFRLHGNDSRKGSKQNFQVRFRAEYGASKLHYRLFDNRDIDSFDSLLLKGGSEDWAKANMRDEIATAMADGSALYVQAMKPVVLYIGDTYWGVYYIRERFSDEYVASHLNVSAESVNILYSSAAYTQTGSGREFHRVKNFVRNNDMSKTENLAYVAQHLDLNSLMDWYVFRSYIGDTDLANIRRFNSKEADGKWHWMYFDLDWGFYNRGVTPVSHLINMKGGESVIMQGLIQNKAFQDAFIKRYAYHLNTVLNEEYICGLIDDLVEQIDSEMVRDRKRWGSSYQSWQKSVQSLRNYASDKVRHTRILRDIKSYFSLTNAQMEAYFGDLWRNLE